jgi:hypothetical protein
VLTEFDPRDGPGSDSSLEGKALLGPSLSATEFSEAILYGVHVRCVAYTLSNVFVKNLDRNAGFKVL